MRAADVLAIDLPWSQRRGRTAIASRVGRSIAVVAVAGDDELVAYVTELAAKNALVLLDVPLHGCDDLSRDRPTREVDRRLAALGIPVLPSYSSGERGPELEARLIGERPDLRCFEVYPYAVLRTLWAVHRASKRFRYDRIVDLTATWRAWPPRYKRERDLRTRQRCVRDVAAVLASVPGLRRAVRTVARATHAQLDALCDEYDALLGLVAGIAHADRSPWSFLARVAHEDGSVMLLADSSSRARFATILRRETAHRVSDRLATDREWTERART